jgi:hypothetical protein
MHWCMDETLAVLALIPIIGIFFRKLHTWWHTHSHHKCHEKTCNEEHVEHPYSPYDKKHWHKDVTVSEEDMKYLRGEPAPLKITIPVVIWEPLTQETVEARFGKELVQDLYDTLRSNGIEDAFEGELLWLVNKDQELMVEVRFRTFIHGYNQCEHGWDEVKDDTGSCCQGLGQE